MAISYKSYCWVVGTTSFRTGELNRKIEDQLGFLDEFWADRRFAAQPWSENDPVQRAYYKLLKEKGFVTGDAHRPEKDAREKTSGLVELGLLNSERRLTGAGRRFLLFLELVTLKLMRAIYSIFPRTVISIFCNSLRRPSHLRTGMCARLLPSFTS